MRYGLLFTPKGIRPYASISLRSRRTQKLSPGESVAFVIMFFVAIIVAAVIVKVVFG